MKFGPCPPKIALALPVLGALIAPTSALPFAKNRFRTEIIPLSLDVVPEKIGDPLINYPEVPVELKEGTAVPEQALVPNQQPDNDVIEHVYNHAVRPLHDVASPIKDRYNASENAQAERGPYEAEDITSIEKRGVLPSLTSEDEEFTQSVQPAPSIPEEEQEETQAELDNPVFDVEPYYHFQNNGEKKPRFTKSVEGLLRHTAEDWQRESWKKSPNDNLEEDWVNAPHRNHVAEPTPAAGPQEPIPDHFDGHVEVPITPDNTTTAEDVDNVDISALLQDRFKGTPAITGDTPGYEVPADLLPEALLHADEEKEEEEEDPEQHIERRATHRHTIQDIEADETDPAAAPEPSATEASPEVSLSRNPLHASREGQAHIDRPVIQN